MEWLVQALFACNHHRDDTAEGRASFALGDLEMFCMVDVRRFAFAMALLVPATVVARSVVVVSIADDVQCMVIRTAGSKLISISKGEVVDGERWYLARIHGSTAILGSKARYRGASTEMQVVAGQSIEFESLPPAGDKGGKK